MEAHGTLDVPWPSEYAPLESDIESFISTVTFTDTPTITTVITRTLMNSAGILETLSLWINQSPDFRSRAQYGHAYYDHHRLSQ
jgi:hypothetical protein